MSLCLCAGTAVAARTLALVGDGTSTSPPSADWARPAAALRALLRHAPAGPWRGARVLDLAIPGTTTRDWVSDAPVWLCDRPDVPRRALLAMACARTLPLAYAVEEATGGTADAALVVLGGNDVLDDADPARTVDRLAQLARILSPLAVYLAPPPPAWTTPRTAFTAAVRDELGARGLLSGPRWPVFPSSDGWHPTAGAAAASAGLWLDPLLGGLPSLPPERTVR